MCVSVWRACAGATKERGSVRAPVHAPEVVVGCGVPEGLATQRAEGFALHARNRPPDGEREVGTRAPAPALRAHTCCCSSLPSVFLTSAAAPPAHATTRAAARTQAPAMVAGSGVDRAAGGGKRC